MGSAFFTKTNIDFYFKAISKKYNSVFIEYKIIK